MSKIRVSYFSLSIINWTLSYIFLSNTSKSQIIHSISFLFFLDFRESPAKMPKYEAIAVAIRKVLATPNENNTVSINSPVA